MSITWPIRVRGMQKGESATATLRISDLNGPGREHFSLTHEVVWKGFGREDLRSCGLLTREAYMRSGATDFNPIYVVPLAFDLHLCNIHTGEPLHARNNALYWCGTSKFQNPDAAALARHLRIDVDQAKVIVMEVRDAYLNSFEHPSHESAQKVMDLWLDKLRPKWADQARQLREVLEVFE